MYSGSRININMPDVSDGEILRYLGHNGQALSEGLLHEISRCKEIIFKSAAPRFVCASYELEREESGIKLKTTDLILAGNDVKALLKNSERCILMAATIGIGVEREINYHQKISISGGVIMDAIATAAIESLCDEIETRLRKIHPLTQRYSCGYGDLPIEIQPKILSALNTQKTIGLFCNEANILIPRKSVTAVMGISDFDGGKINKNCDSCLYNEGCNLKKGGAGCGNFGIRKE